MTGSVIGRPNTDLFTKVELPAPHKRAIFSIELPGAMHLAVFELSRVSGITVVVKRISQLRLSQTFQQNPAGQRLQQHEQPSMLLQACPRL